MYVLIPHIMARGVNIMQSSSILTPVPLFAANMLGHMIGIKTGSRCNGVGLVFHNAKTIAEHSIKVSQPKSGKNEDRRFYLRTDIVNQRGAMPILVKGCAKEGHINGQPFQPAASADIEVSLILEMERSVSVDDIKRILRSAKLGGGVIDRHNKIMAFDNIEATLKHVSAGFFVTDASEVVKARQGKGLSIIEAVLHKVERDEDAGIEPGWYAPVTIGYSPISGFAARKGAREGKEHAFAEPLVGLVRLVPITAYRESVLGNENEQESDEDDDDEFVFSEDDDPQIDIPLTHVFWKHTWESYENDVSIFKLYQ